MKTKFSVLGVLLTLLLGGFLVFSGCSDSGSDDDKTTNVGISFDVSVNTPTGEDTNRLDFVFSDVVSGLTAANITISPQTRITKGSVTGEGRNWSLSISVTDEGFIGPIASKVTVNLAGVQTSSKDATIVKNSGLVDYSVSADKVEDDGTSALNFIFLNKDVTLTANQVTISPANAAEKGSISKISAREYKLPLTNVVEGTIKVTIKNTAVNAEAKEDIELSKDEPSAPNNPNIPGVGVGTHPGKVTEVIVTIPGTPP